MIKTTFNYSHNGESYLVSAKCNWVDSLNAENLKIRFMDEETLDYVKVKFTDREWEEFEELCMEKLDETQYEMELGYASR